MSVYIVPYKMSSQSAKEIASALQIKRKRAERIRSGDFIINWGSSSIPREILETASVVLNHPSSVQNCVDKVEFFRRMVSFGMPIPDFATNQADAARLFKSNEAVVYCRTLAKSTKGKGIVVAKSPDELVPAPLYTVGIPCKREYRVHVINEAVVDLTAKVQLNKKNEDYKIPSKYIRNVDNGYVFARDAVKIPDQIRGRLQSLATNAISYCNLDFGAVDIIRDTKDNLYVLEVNTAPGCTGTTLDQYLKYLTRNLVEYASIKESPKKINKAHPEILGWGNIEGDDE